MTRDYALEASFLRISTAPAIPRLSSSQEDGSGTTLKLVQLDTLTNHRAEWGQLKQGGPKVVPPLAGPGFIGDPAPQPPVTEWGPLMR